MRCIVCSQCGAPVAGVSVRDRGLYTRWQKGPGVMSGIEVHIFVDRLGDVHETSKEGRWKTVRTGRTVCQDDVHDGSKKR